MRISAFRSIAAALALGSLAACATPFQANVARFQQLPAAQGQTFRVVPQDSALNGSLEFAHYAELVSAAMSRQGYRAAGKDGPSDFTVRLAYGVDKGRERIVDDGFGDPFLGYGGYGGYGFGGLGFGGYRGFRGYPSIYHGGGGYGYVRGFYDPFLFGPGFGGQSSYTVYTSSLNLVIERADGGARLFEGTAEAMSRSDDLTRLVPNLVDAMFTGFPGNNGERTRITVAPAPTAR